MKFLCPQCKAKYRIADEKLAERQSSRMKCRKCGHVIDIHSATVPDDSIPPPGVAPNELEPAPATATPSPTAARKPGAAVPRATSGAGAAGAARRPATAATPAVRRPTATAAAVKRPIPPPRRGGAAAAAVAEKTSAVADDQALPTAPAATKPALTKPTAEPIPKPPEEPRAATPAAPAAKAPEPLRGEFEEEPTRIHDSLHLAAAFSSVASQAVPSAAAPAQADEWYIGIDGSPIGPVGVSVIREKAAERKATFESLVWREGFEEWKPLKEFPELVAVVEEARRDLPVDAHEQHTIPAPSPLDAQPLKAKAMAGSSSDVPSELL